MTTVPLAIQTMWRKTQNVKLIGGLVFPTPRVFGAPVWVTSLEFHKDWVQRKLESLGYPAAFLRDDMFSCLIEHRLVTDKHIKGHSIYCTIVQRRVVINYSKDSKGVPEHLFFYIVGVHYLLLLFQILLCDLYGCTTNMSCNNHLKN